jgi:alpha-galactosidase/6-phospho-beta-glucosidase family protein
MADTKIACLGGGSLYFPRVLGDLALEEELAGSEVVLYDIDGGKAELMAALGRRLAQDADLLPQFTERG